MNLHGFLPDMNYRHLLFFLACFFCGASLADINISSGAEPAAVKTDFIRFVENDQGASLQTAIASYVSPTGVIVDLIGAVHIADKNYFDALNQYFKGYDSVLYELVGRPVEQRTEMKVADGHAKLQWLGQMQETMRKKLALESQLQCIDYKAPNFVHADMSTEGFLDTQKDKKENFLTLWMKAAIASSVTADPEKEEPSMMGFLAMLMRDDNARKLKLMVGREFDRVENLMAGIESGDGTVIIGERNRHALEVLKKQIDAGKKHLAIFYGAAHFPDMEQRLLKQGYKLEKTEWLKAWDLPNEK
jgi:hypothetical protein